MPHSTSITKCNDILLFGGADLGKMGKSLESDISAPNKDMRVKFGTKLFLTNRNKCGKFYQNWRY